MFPQLAAQFLIDPEVTFLNFASFGACPRPVFDRYQAFQLELEREPVKFLVHSEPNYLQQSRLALGKLLNVSDEDIILVTNPSYAVNILAKSLKLKPGDEILSTDLEYGACDRTWKFVCRKAKSVYNRQHIRLPAHSKEALVNAVIAGISPRTKVLFISHVTSATALRLPVKEICAAARRAGVLTFVDGAHGPGLLDLDLQDIDCDFYTGACHKWLMAPKGCSFLYARKSVQNLLDPLVVSWGYEAIKPSGNDFWDYHQKQGTRDSSAFCALPAALDFMQENDWEMVRTACRNLTLEWSTHFHELLNAESIYPDDPYFDLQMKSIRIGVKDPDFIQNLLVEKYKIQIPIMNQGTQNFLRYSIQAFNKKEDLQRLYDVLQTLKREGKILC